MEYTNVNQSPEKISRLMKPGSGNAAKVLWSEMFPVEFKTRMAHYPLVYLPLGLCEPHGQISAFGLDTIKAEWLCVEAARCVGGIVAPTQGYHIHETGYHARWLEEVVGEENPHMTGMPPDVVLRRAAELFMESVPVQIFVASDPELVEGQFVGDHAGKYEISQLMYLRPELISFPLRLMENEPNSGGRLALGEDSSEATAEFGERIMQACLQSLCETVKGMRKEVNSLPGFSKVSYDQIEKIWSNLTQTSGNWTTASPWPGQKRVSDESQWKFYEYFKTI